MSLHLSNPWKASRISVHIFSFQCCGLSLPGILGISFWEHLKGMMLLFVLCRHVTIRVRSRIIFGEVQNFITAAKEKKTVGKKSPLHKSTGSTTYRFLEDIAHSAWCLWPLFLAPADYGHTMILLILFPSFPGPLEMIHSLNIHVSCIQILLSWPQQKSRGVCFFTCDFRGWFSFHLAPCPKEIIFLSCFF